MYRKFVKRILDIIFALILIPFVLPVILICGLLTKTEDRGPVFYLGKRLGKDQKIFKMYKLRSMKVNAPDIRNEDGSTFNSDDDPRVTKMGKFIRKTSLDELPQIINVLTGDMSFIGPRPDLPEHKELYKGNEGRKLEIRPGVTGLNQAYYRNTVPWKERIQHDIFYIDNLSLWLDTKIFFKTVITVLKRRDIYVVSSNGSKTPPKTGMSI